MAKPEFEFTASSSVEFADCVPHNEGQSEAILASDDANDSVTRILRFEPGTDTSANGVLTHDFWEEVFIFDGSFVDQRLGTTFSAGDWATARRAWNTASGFPTPGRRCSRPVTIRRRAADMAMTGLFTEPDGLAMCRTMGRFLAGVGVVTTTSQGELHGMTINSLNCGTCTGDALLESSRFAISILGAMRENVARKFAVRGGERFEDGSFDMTESGLPVVKEALSQAGCKVVHQYDIGDHQVFFGQVTECRDRDGEGLAFNAGKFGAFQDFNHQEMPWFF